MFNLIHRLFSRPSLTDEGRRLLGQGRLMEAAHLLSRQAQGGSGDRSVRELYAQVLCAQQRYAEALELTRSLKANGQASLALHLLEGNCLDGMGEVEAALLAYHEALGLDPLSTEAITRICRLLCTRDEKAEALRVVDQAIAQRPDDIDLILCRGNVLFALERLQLALADFEKVLKLDPGHVHAMSNLSVIAAEQQDFTGAERWMRRALEQSPNDPNLRMRLARYLQLGNQTHEAIELLSTLREEQPESVEIHRLLGELYATQQQLQQAATCFAQAALLDTSSPAAFLQLGKVLFELGLYDDAVKALHKSVAIKSSGDAHRMCGLALLRSFRVEEAIEQLELALGLEPENPDTQTLLSVARGVLLEGTRGATEEYRKILQANPTAHFVHSNLLFNLSFDESCSPQEYLAEARRFGDQMRKDLTSASVCASAKPSASQDGRIRLGMVSGDLHMHPVGYFLDALLSNIDRNRFSVYLYSNSFKEDAVTARLKAHSDAWRNLRFSDDHEGARQVESDGVDILFDLGGHTGKNRLGIFAIRAAPIQITWLGYWASTGLQTMDYILADPLCLPVEDEGHYVEEVLRLPVTRLCFGASLAGAPAPSRSAWSMNGYVTFGCAQSLHKIGSEVLAAWSVILARLPTARLNIRNMQLSEPKVQQATLARLQAAGLPTERIRLLPPLSREGYLQAYSELDICLDTFPFPGGTTTCDALWMGVPTITRRGHNMIGKQGEAMLTAAGLSDWVTDDTTSYIEKACAVGADPEALPELRRSLRNRVKISALFDGPRFANDFQSLMETTIRKHSPRTRVIPLEEAQTPGFR